METDNLQHGKSVKRIQAWGVCGKRGERLQTRSPEISTQSCLVFHQECEEPTAFGAIDLPVLPDIRSKDTSHAFFWLRNKMFHIPMAFRAG